MATTTTSKQQQIDDMHERIEAARSDGSATKDLEAQLDFLEHSDTTAELRREIKRDYLDVDPRKDRALAQLDGLDERGIHRIERYKGQTAHIAVGDAYEGEAAKEREREKTEAAEDAQRRHQGDRSASLDRGAYIRPEPSKAEWAKGYDITQDGKTGVVSYAREGEEKIRDDGRNVAVADDPASIRDAVRLVKEQGVERIAVRAEDPEKRQAIMRECVRQNLKIEMPSKDVEAEYTKAHVAVARERAIEKREHEPTKNRVNEGPEIGD